MRRTSSGETEFLSTYLQVSEFTTSGAVGLALEREMFECEVPSFLAESSPYSRTTARGKTKDTFQSDS